MFMGVTYLHSDGTELKSVLNTNIIEQIIENKERPDTCALFVHGNDSPVLIKGSYDDISKILFSFNRARKENK